MMMMGRVEGDGDTPLTPITSHASDWMGTPACRRESLASQCCGGNTEGVHTASRRKILLPLSPSPPRHPSFGLGGQRGPG